MIKGVKGYENIRIPIQILIFFKNLSFIINLYTILLKIIKIFQNFTDFIYIFNKNLIFIANFLKNRLTL